VDLKGEASLRDITKETEVDIVKCEVNGGRIAMLLLKTATTTTVINKTGNGNCHPSNRERAIIDARKRLQTRNLLLKDQLEEQPI
jgi:hypothetical protein